MKIIDEIAELRIRLNRGQGLFYEIRNAVLIAAGVKIIIELSVVESIIATVLILIGFFIVGCLDLNYLKLAQKENELNTSKYNPHLNKLNRLTEKFK